MPFQVVGGTGQRSLVGLLSDDDQLGLAHTGRGIKPAKDRFEALVHVLRVQRATTFEPQCLDPLHPAVCLQGCWVLKWGCGTCVIWAWPKVPVG
jgi:hypothetical protein